MLAREWCFYFLSWQFVFFILVISVSGQEISVKSNFQADDFRLADKTSAADILISVDDFKVVNIAANDFASDVARVSGNKPKVKNISEAHSGNIVLIGTSGKNPLIEDLIKNGKIDVSKISNKWESFLIATVKKPLPNVESALVIVGSDRRGTAFGVYEMSQMIGVSPWVWWADVAPEKRENLIISAGIKQSGEPSVKYRGIFLNDEDWGLQPWAAKTFEPETGNIGPKTYARIFELLLRLKANTCWPAMHEVTKPFNEIPQNAQIADDYAIVMGSSHAEPMLRNNVGEWKDDKEKYNFVSNPTGVTNYWEERVKTNGKFESIYTLGMRGIHDSPIQGTKNQAERIPVLEKIISTQRNLLAKYVNENVEKIPQIFCPYKEVLADYNAGLKIPDDVTVVFPDDNFGYIRYFPSPEEQKRKGGFGIYYHISYLGKPISYLWLETTPPALIWEEMSKAYDHNMHDFWILNVGDLKPAEIGIEFFMQMAWDIKKWKRDNSKEFLEDLAKRDIGNQNAKEIADIMDRYYRLGFARKPEHLQWNLPGEPTKPSDFSAVNYGDEMQKRLDEYESLTARANKIYNTLTPDKKDAFYELVLYPVRSAALANQRFFAVEKSILYAGQKRASAKEWVQKAEAANAQIQVETNYYNEKLAGGKWRGIMSPEMNKGQWTSMRSTVPTVPQEVIDMKIPEPAGLGVAVEGQEKASQSDTAATLPIFNGFTKDVHFIDVFNMGKLSAKWTAKANQNWIGLSQTSGNLSSDSRIWVSIDWSKAPKDNQATGEIEIAGANLTLKITVLIFNPKLPNLSAGFVEANGVISIEAEDFTNKTDKNGAAWQIISGLGRSGDSVSVFPTTAKSINTENIQGQSPTLEYKFYSFSTGNFDTRCFLIPTQPLHSGNGLRYAIGVDDQPPQIVTVGAKTEVSSKEWSLNVLNADSIGTSKIKLSLGSHVLKIYMVDAGVVMDKIVINTGGEQKSYLAPTETKVIASKN